MAAPVNDPREGVENSEISASDSAGAGPRRAHRVSGTNDCDSHHTSVVLRPGVMMEPVLTLRFARAGDEARLFALVEELARFERLEQQLQGGADELAAQLFGPEPAAEALVALRGEEIVGYAIFFKTFSTFLVRPGIWLEDLFVTERERGRGTGKALLAAVATIAEQRGAGRFEWSVLDWNRRAISFYEALGATLLPDWRICRVAGAALRALATQKGGGVAPD